MTKKTIVTIVQAKWAKIERLFAFWRGRGVIWVGQCTKGSRGTDTQTQVADSLHLNIECPPTHLHLENKAEDPFQL